MALLKISDFNPKYREDVFEGKDVKNFNVYAGETDQKIGTVYDLLVDESGRFRYIVVDTGIWILGKKVLLPVGRSRLDMDNARIYALGLTSKQQAEKLPHYEENMTIDFDYEEQVRSLYRTEAANFDRHTYSYDHEPSLYGMSNQDRQTLYLYEERLITNKQRHQTGEVTVGKRVETRTAQASVPVEHERVVIERKAPNAQGTPVSASEANFQGGEVARMEVYEETADIKKQAFVREEVNVRKEVESETVKATETVRREELDLDVQGNPVIRDSKSKQ